MNEATHQQLKEQAEFRHQERIKKSEQERDKALKAIELVHGLGCRSLYQRKTHPLREALCEMSDTFTRKDMKKYLDTNYPGMLNSHGDSYIGSALHRFVKSGYITRIEDGRGRLPAKYQRTGD